MAIQVDTQVWADSLIGYKVGERYQLHRLIGVGGMGAVYEAQHHVLNRRVAVKLLVPNLVIDPVTVRRLQQEAEFAASVSKRGVPEIVDFDVDAELGPFIVMELLEGESLEAHLKKHNKLKPIRAVRIGLGITSILSEVHQRGIIHRDLKPANIFLCQEGGKEVVKIMDFGVSRVAINELGLTEPGKVLGTLRYMPPEQARGVTDLDHRADLYAVGAILYRCLSGLKPYEGLTRASLLVAVTQGPPEPLHKVNPDLPMSVCFVVDHALAFDREKRFCNADDFHNALESLMGELDRESFTAMPTPVPTPLPLTDSVKIDYLRTSDSSLSATSFVPHTPWYKSPIHLALAALVPFFMIALVGGAILSWMFLSPASDSQRPTNQPTQVSRPARLKAPPPIKTAQTPENQHASLAPAPTFPVESELSKTYRSLLKSSVELRRLNRDDLAEQHMVGLVKRASQDNAAGDTDAKVHVASAYNMLGNISANRVHYLKTTEPIKAEIFTYPAKQAEIALEYYERVAQWDDLGEETQCSYFGMGFTHERHGEAIEHTSKTRSVQLLLSSQLIRSYVRKVPAIYRRAEEHYQKALAIKLKGRCHSSTEEALERVRQKIKAYQSDPHR